MESPLLSSLYSHPLAPLDWFSSCFSFFLFFFFLFYFLRFRSIDRDRFKFCFYYREIGMNTRVLAAFYRLFSNYSMIDWGFSLKIIFLWRDAIENRSWIENCCRKRCTWNCYTYFFFVQCTRIFSSIFIKIRKSLFINQRRIFKLYNDNEKLPTDVKVMQLCKRNHFKTFKVWNLYSDNREFVLFFFFKDALWMRKWEIQTQCVKTFKNFPRRLIGVILVCEWY